MFSPTSIANFLACQHLTALDRAEAAGEIKRPFFANPGLDLLVTLGLAHEETYLRVLAEEQNLDIAKIPSDIPRKDAGAQTVDAIRGGAEVIYQATFLSDRSKSPSRLRSLSIKQCFRFKVHPVLARLTLTLAEPRARPLLT